MTCFPSPAFPSHTAHKRSSSLFPPQNEHGFLLRHANSYLHNSTIFVPDDCVSAWLYSPPNHPHRPPLTHQHKTHAINIHLLLQLSTNKSFYSTPLSLRTFTLHSSTVHRPSTHPVHPSPHAVSPSLVAWFSWLYRHYYFLFAYHFTFRPFRPTTTRVFYVNVGFHLACIVQASAALLGVQSLSQYTSSG